MTKFHYVIPLARFSPAFTMRIEHPTGQDFADHLQSLSDYFELPIREKTDVLSIEKHDEFFHLEIEGGKIFAFGPVSINL